jgi:hypothetical protein
MAERRPTLSRRQLLTAAAGVAGLIATPTALLLGKSAALAATPGVALNPIAPLPPAAPIRNQFALAEQRFAGYLATLPGITNDIDTGTNPDNYGWMAGGWSRTPEGPTNARVQEHVFTLSWFYANQRPWNPYYLDPALLARLDAALFHYLRLQQTDGSFPEYSATEHGLAPTAFGLGYLAKTLVNLRQVDALPQVRTQIETALRKGMGWLLNSANTIWVAPIFWTNQVTAGLAGSALALQLIPDAALSAKLSNRIGYLSTNGQSPAGFFYDPRGMDINYNFEVMLPELAEVYLRTGNATTVSMASKFSTWFGYNMLREPDNSGWLTYYAASARTASAAYDDVLPDNDRTTLGAAFISQVPSLAAFYSSAEGKAAMRATWAADPAPAPALAKLDTSPRIITHATYQDYWPSNAQKTAAIAQLPYLAATDWAEVRKDTATNQHFMYSRRPNFYLGAFFGTRATDIVRGGTGFLWTPTAGTVIHCQQTNTGSWGTVLSSGVPDSANNLTPTYSVGTSSWNGSRIVPGTNAVKVVYKTPNSNVITTLTLNRTSLVRAVKATSSATEQVPLVLLPTDTVTWSTGVKITYNTNSSATASSLTIRRGAATIVIGWGSSRGATVSTSTRTYLKDAQRRIHMLRIPHSGTLTVTYTVS